MTEGNTIPTITNENVAPKKGREIAILVPERLSMAKVLLKLEIDGYEVRDVLPLLRALIVYLTDEQLKDIERMGESTWTKTVATHLTHASKK